MSSKENEYEEAHLKEKQNMKKTTKNLNLNDLQEIAEKIRFPDSNQYLVRFLLKTEKTYGAVRFDKLDDAKKFTEILKKHKYASDEYEIENEEDPEVPYDVRLNTTYFPPYKLQVRGYSAPNHNTNKNGIVYCVTDTFPFKDKK